MKDSIKQLRNSIISMKAINDATVNLGTGLLILLASSLICAPHPDVFRWEVSNDVRVIFLSFTALIALMNVTGIPKQEFWKEFGAAYFPGSIEEKQRLAGLLESLGILLTIMEFPTLRGFGYALLMVLYGRGAMVNARLGHYDKMMFATAVSLTSGLLLKDEFYAVSL